MAEKARKKEIKRGKARKLWDNLKSKTYQMLQNKSKFEKKEYII